MGCDIHLHVEIKVKGNNEWQHYNQPHCDRYYPLFAKMANVRNYEQYGPIEPISQPKGFPEDASLTTKFCYDYQYGDAHSASWLNLDEIKELSKWFNKELKKSDDYHGFESNNRFGYLFGNPFEGFNPPVKPSAGYPEDLQDVRFVFWFDN